MLTKQYDGYVENQCIKWLILGLYLSKIFNTKHNVFKWYLIENTVTKESLKYFKNFLLYIQKYNNLRLLYNII